ncbi:MAG TPA: trypsin-like peptidase domain-containing protein [Candidatus Saccharimonadales bacterium]|nr:trypsin-like peptidase domain-containing protein [Candidatus Saccharimonadales bacterium]
MAEESLKTNGKKIDPRWHTAGIVLLCFVASFLGAWAFAGTGLIGFNAQTITENREKIVLQEGEIVADVFKKVSPSTVAITTESVSGGNRYVAPQVSRGAGSGIVISKDGYILTNKHVVPEGVNAVTVVMHDGHEYSNVKVVGRDPLNDIAFLKIEGVSDLVPAILGDSGAVEVGQKVVAIGNALGQFRNTVTSGIISGIGRPIEAQNDLGAAEKLENLLQTDASINPGNSGGPLVNLKGEVIGVNTAIADAAEAIGFAIPINDAKNIINSMLTKGHIVKPYLGVRYVSLNPEVAAELGVEQKKGAIIVSGSGQAAVISGSPADKAGLVDRDIIIKVNEAEVDNDHSLASRLAQFNPGDKVELTIIRSGKEQKVSVTLEEYPQ